MRQDSFTVNQFQFEDYEEDGELVWGPGEFDLFDSNLDGEITNQEYHDGYRKWLAAHQVGDRISFLPIFDMTVSNLTSNGFYPELWLTLFDKDADGTIEHSEWLNGELQMNRFEQVAGIDPKMLGLVPTK